MLTSGTDYTWITIAATLPVVVRGYSANPGAGLMWPGDWKPMLTPKLAVAAGIAPGGSVVVGPFKWKPQVVGHECMFMEVSAKGDLSNIDPGTFFPCAAGPTPEWRVVPFDNNIGQRNVVPVAGGGGLRGLLSSFVERQFVVGNPLEREARIEVKAELPKFLSEGGWGITLNQRNDNAAFSLASGNRWEVAVALRPGKEFTREDVLQAGKDVAIRVYVYADGMIIGGMTYELDASLSRAPIEKKGDSPISLRDSAIEEAIGEAQFQDEESGSELAIADEAGIYQAAVESGGGDDTTNSAGQLLSRLGVDEGITGKVRAVKVKRVTIEIELSDD